MTIDKHYPSAYTFGGIDISFPFPLDSVKSLEYKFLDPLELGWKSGKEGKEEEEKRKKKKNTRNGSIHGYNERDSSPGKIFFGKSKTTARPSLASNLLPQDRPFSLLHSLFPIHQAFVTVIQIPIVIYVDINGNPSSCRCSSAFVLLLLHPSPLPLRTIERTPSSLPPSLLLVQTLCFIESELSPLLLPSRHHPSTHPSLHPRITRFFD